MTMRKRFVALIALGCLVRCGERAGAILSLRTVTMIVTAAAGGVTDVVARALGQRLSERWGQQVVIENKGGGGHISWCVQPWPRPRPTATR